MSGLSVFKNPELRAQAAQIQERFSMPDEDGSYLYGLLRTLLIRQGEWNFEQQIKDHPHGMPCQWLAGDDNGEKEAQVNSWLRTHVPEDDYILMPADAQGKYRHHWNWIYFKQKDQAMLFKLTWF